jgi:predicted ribosome quality control (RQC) complex YloA/Tae2 family protein
MAFDGLMMAAITAELQVLAGARVEKIHQPARATLIVNLHQAAAGRVRLLLSADAAAPRVHLTTTRPTNPPAPPMFCMLLRKYLEGARLKSVKQHGLERILFFDFDGRDELGNLVTYRLVLEAMGRHSNLILLNREGKVLDCINHVPPALSTVRIMLPGISYSLPGHQERTDTLAVTNSQELSRVLKQAGNLQLKKAMTSQLTGISPLLADELLSRASLEAQLMAAELSEAQADRLWQQIVTLQQMVHTGRFQPSASGRRFAALRLTHLAAADWPGTVNSLLDQITQGQQAEQELERARQKLLHVVRRETRKAQRTLQNRRGELQAMQEDLQLRTTGELILANLHLIPPKATIARLVDYYDPQLREIDVQLNPSLSAAQNAQRHFKRYERARQGIPIVERNIQKSEARLRYLDSLLDSLERADSLQLVSEIEEEMRETGLLPQVIRRKKPHARQSEGEPLRFIAADGCEILVGRNNQQNDRLTRSASPEDWWLHTKDIAGSHVIIKGAKGEPTAATLQMAAELAAYFSKARQSAKVPVDYTRRKYVKKPSGSPPGFVIYTDQRTLLVDPRLPTGEQAK